MTVLEPVKLNLDPALRGKARRRAAGAALYDIMSDMIYKTTPTDRTIPEALIAAGKEYGLKCVATEDVVTGALTYKRLMLGARILGKKLMPLAELGKPVGVMLPNANGAVVTIFGLMSAGRVPAMINFTAGAANILAGCRAAQITTIVTARSFIERGKLEPLVEKLSAEVSFVYLEDVRATVGLFDKLVGTAELQEAAGAASAGRLGRDPVHFGFGGRAEGRRAVAPQHPDQCGAGARASRFQPLGQGVQHPAGVPFVRADGRRDPADRVRACRSSFIPRRCITAPCRNWFTASTPRSCSAPTRS